MKTAIHCNKMVFIKYTSLIMICLIMIANLVNGQPIPWVVAGKVDRIDNLSPEYINNRLVDVWLPENYNPEKRYAVLYMHDGQMLFDSTTTWNKQAWDVDDALTELLNSNSIRDVIVVGIWNVGESRHADYFPQKPFQSLSREIQESVYSAARSNGYSVFNEYNIQSDLYLKFIVTELKPYIDTHYSTLPGQEHTFIAGSSMGGLISLYAICEYPDVFGGAACLSTHWPGIFTMENNPVPEAFFNYMKSNLPDPKTHKIYFDYGDQTLDAMYPPLQQKADEVMKAKGYDDNSWKTLFFPGKDHSEKAWKERLSIPLKFLLKN